MVRQRSAKPLSAGSIPAVASIFPTPPAFRFDATVRSHGWYQLAPFRWAPDSSVLYRPETVAAQSLDLEIRSERGGLTVRGGPKSAAGKALLKKRLTRMFQLDVDVADFHKLAAESSAHEWVIDAGFGRLLCGSTAFEDAVKIIATTNTTWGQTKRMVGLLVEKCGPRTPAGAACFPSPADVVRFTESELQQDCRLGYRAKSIHLLASGIVAGSIDLDRLGDRSQSTEDLYRSYQSLPGIGPYGAAHLLAMDGRHDVIAVDSEFRRFVRETYHRGRKIADSSMLRRYAKWGRWKYLAYWSELWSEVAERVDRG